MLGTERMQKVRIVVLDERKSDVISALHGMGIIDFRKSRLELGDDQPLAHYNELSELLVKFEGAIRLLAKSRVSKTENVGLEKLLKLAAGDKAIDGIYGLDAESKDLEEEKKHLEYAERVAESFLCLNIDFGKLKSDRLAFNAFDTDADTLAGIEKEIADKRIQAEVLSCKKGKSVAALISYEKHSKIEELLNKPALKEIDLTAKYVEGTPASMLKNVKEMASRNAHRTVGIKKELDEMSAKDYARLVNTATMLELALERADASLMFKRTDKTIVIEGWIQANRSDELKKKISEITKGAFIIEEFKDEELAPTKSKNPGILKPFDYMMDFFSLPRSDEIDPTIIFAISFPIFYGFMVTDAGYGILSFLFATWITKITHPEDLVWNAAQIWRLSAVSAIFFGVLTNQYFGLALNQYFLPFTGIDWMKSITTFIVISVAFGLVQVIGGLLIGFVNKYRKREMKLAVSKITSILAVLFGVVMVAGGFFHLFSTGVTEVSGLLALVSFVATIALSGEGAAETTSLITHPLSYLRLMGFGLGGVILAFLIDQAFTPSLSQGPIIFFLYLIIFLVLHTLNMIVSIFEGMVQGIRLNFVEFYTKFYTGGGVKFRPFKSDEIYAKKQVVL